MNDEQGKMLLKEYDEMAGHLRTFWTIRASVLGVGLTLTGLMLKLGIDSPTSFKYVLLIALPFLVIAQIKMTGSLTRSLYIFSFRMVEIASLFKVDNFWRVWSQHVVRRPNDSGSYPYILIMYFLNGLVFLFVASSSIIIFLDAQRPFAETISALLIALISLVVAVYSHYSVRKEIDPSEFKGIIHSEWDKSKDEERLANES